ncbi:MAG: FkbM family methyltransferase [Rhodobacteraceae bacterium]|nr:FkbM family methyltransferase [Paracoccaceae bacterium]
MRSKKQFVDKENFTAISKRSNPERVLKRKYRQKLARGFISGLKTLLGPDHVCVDCGANVGEITGTLAQTGAQVHAFEPDPYSFGELTRKFGDTPNVHLYNQAVGVGSGTINIYRKKSFDEDQQWNSLTTTTILNEKSEKGLEAVEIEKIDLENFLLGILKTHEIAFLKMDIEGAELEILERLVQTDIFTKIRATAVEIHPWMFPGQNRFKALRQISSERPDFNLNLDWY